MNELVIQPGERILFEEPNVVWVRGWLRRPHGRLCFTTQRLLFEVALPDNARLMERELTNRVPVDIPRDALHAVERTNHRRTVALLVKTEYESFKFVGCNLQHWLSTLKQAMHDDGVAMQNLLDRLKPKENPPPYR